MKLEHLGLEKGKRDNEQRLYFKAANFHKKEYPFGLYVGSIIGNIRAMLSVMGLSYMIFDDYELLDEIVTTYADMQYKCIEKVLEIVGSKFTFAHYWEDICYKSGPLFSPKVLEDLCGKHYKKRNDLLKKYGIDLISLDYKCVYDLTDRFKSLA